MEDEFRREARRQYLRYFSVWFIIVGALLLVFLTAKGVNVAVNHLRENAGSAERTNMEAPAERVYDYADVLTAQEEESLRAQIAQAERRLRMDIVIVTIDQSVEGWEAMEEYGYRSEYWEDNMEDLADDFWDENKYGYDQSFEGDGALLLHNWYPGQNGEHISTSGRAEWELGDRELDEILYEVDRYYEKDPYKAYSEYVEALEYWLEAGSGNRGSFPFSWGVVLFVPLVAALIYALANLGQSKAKNTVTATTYVAGGKPQMNSQQDNFIRKSVSTRHIERSSGSSQHSGGGHSGGGGHHHSSSGASHGGRSHRH